MEAIRIYRRKAELTQAKLAEVAGVSSASMISHYEAGRFDPTSATLAKLAEALGVTEYDLRYAEEVLERRRAVEKAVEEYALTA